jgi:glycosyltransferase involved in cell wall biosynthesis
MISLIICTYNRDKYIYECLRHIAINNFPTGLSGVIIWRKRKNLRTDKIEAI